MRTGWNPMPWVGFVLTAAAGLGADDRPWVEVRSPRFTVVSQSGEKAARDLAWQFEQVHSVFSRAYPWAKLESGRPFVVLAVRNESALRELSPQFWQRWKMRPGAAFVSDSGQDFVAIRTDLDGSDVEGENPYSTAYEGYVSIVLNASFPGRLPFWFERGMQDFFGNTLVREKDVHIGRLIKRHLELLNRGSRFPLAELLAIGSDSPSFRQEASRQVFEAQAWLFVHYLFFGENGANLPKLNRYADLLRDGRAAPDAFREALGDTKPLEDGLNLYLSRRLYRYTQLNLDVNVDRASFRVRPVGGPEATALRAAFLSAMREPASEARALAESVLKADPKQPVAHEALGLIADDEKRPDDARAAFALAVENGSQSFWAHYRLAQLLWKADNERATLQRIAGTLEKSTQLNPDHAWSWSYLADTRVDLADAAGALEPARRAVRLAPGEPYHRRTLARVLGNLGPLDAAQQEAGRALALSKDEDDKRRAREMLLWVSRKLEAATASANAPATSAPTAGTAAPVETATAEASTQESRTVTLEKHPCEMNKPQLCRAWLADAEKACADGSLEACSSAGWAYSGAPGVTQDPAKAARLLEKACSGGHQAGCLNLAVNLANRQTPEALDRALELLRKACAAGTRQACTLEASLKANRRR
jgi:tetratricopeptide (TPR) repeat protein